MFVLPPTLFLLHLLLAYFSFLFSRAPRCTVYLEGYVFGGLSIWRAIYNWRDPSSFLPPSLFLPPCSFLSFSEDSIISLTLTLKPLGINHVHRPTHAPTGPRVRQLRGCHFISPTPSCCRMLVRKFLLPTTLHNNGVGVEASECGLLARMHASVVFLRMQVHSA